MFSALGAWLASAASTGAGWLGSAGSWIGSNLGSIGSAAGGIGGALGSLFGGSQSSANSKKLAAYQAQLQYDYQKKAWQEGPSLQRKGLEAAGYNPMLAITGGASFPEFRGSNMVQAHVPDIAGSAKAGAEIGKSLAEFANLELKEKEAVIDSINSDTLRKNIGVAVDTAKNAAEIGADVATINAANKIANRNRKPPKNLKRRKAKASKAAKGLSITPNQVKNIGSKVLNSLGIGIPLMYGSAKAGEKASKTIREDKNSNWNKGKSRGAYGGGIPSYHNF